MHETSSEVESQQDTNLSELSDIFLRDSWCTGQRYISRENCTEIPNTETFIRCKLTDETKLIEWYDACN
jgi:hypothetical protein